MNNDCGCCIVVVPEGSIENRPWLSAIAYRLGTFESFKKSIVDELSHTPELAGLSTRARDDYTITAIELWSAVADVLTFYQERIANEAFLRTATQRDSMLRLVRLLDYQLRPGAAATTQLAFTLEAGTRALIPERTRTQSVPGEGEKPQKFETSAPLLADARLNRLRLFSAPEAAHPTAQGAAAAIVGPDAEAIASASALVPSDRVILYAQNAIEILTVRDVKTADDALIVRWQSPVSSDKFGTAYSGGVESCRAYKLGRSFHLFGFDAAPVVVVPERTDINDATSTYLRQVDTNYALHGDGVLGEKLALDARYDGLKPGNRLLVVATVSGATTAIPFEISAASQQPVSRGTIPTTTPPASACSGMVTHVTLAALGSQTIATLGAVDVRNVIVYELVGDALRFWPYSYPRLVTGRHVYLPGRRNGWSSIEVERTIEKGSFKPGTTIDVTDLGAGRTVLLTDAKGGAPVAATIVGAVLTGLDIGFGPTDSDNTTVVALGLAPSQVTPITALVSAQLAGTISIPSALRELNVTIGTLPAQTIALGAGLSASATLQQVAEALQTAIRAALPMTASFSKARVFVMPLESRIAVVAGTVSDRLSFAPSVNDPATVIALGFDAARARWLDGVMSAKIAVPPPLFDGFVKVRTGIDEAQTLRFLASAASAQALAGAITLNLRFSAAARDDNRLIVLPPVPVHEPRSFVKLSLEPDQPVALDSASAMLLGNVVPASHGETVYNEIVGDGNAALAFQQFTLKKKPLTYVPAAVPGGVESSLRVLVNGVRWKEVPTLYGASPLDEVYVTRIANDATTTVQFGDGVTGARVPTGRQNIVALYRQGLGLAGRVGARKIATLLDRPTGVKGVVNLVAADGGADPETIDNARQAAPGTVRTFGRAVSLRDFEDTALTAGEVAKASATWVWTGERRAIHLTIAAQGGGTFSAVGLRRIAATLLAERDPNHKLLVDNYTAVPVLIDASIIVDDRYVTAAVLSAARTALLREFTFEQRRFAQPVYLSEIFAMLQNVEGVVAVDVNGLDLKSSDSAFRTAHGIDSALGQPLPRILMLPARLNATRVVLPAELACIEVPEQDVILGASGGLSS